MTDIVVLQTNAFLRAYKKLHNNQKDAIDQAVTDIVLNPVIGEQKKGDLAGIYVHKFKCVGQLFLLAYEFDPATRTLLLVGTHENFYRNLKH
ncbi:type II toxin-antitoxin system RelE/ParE family toxin [Mariprofundus sp. EBB-1]|uniref:type II toxin-antitoxin system RelE/ParE family toxin n=1 Tax=Mariprofundus sp. EBB-1 TaxID=2650971 RepID=UPI000EF1B07F|nr:type II toxin-antitoxin system RelE/ParE family toxin [Mariprofundus sp. EBB-1]RLL55882.1 type II toxin-antitoxin system RelE/ParE family toxin [Mariprofundus sp. EBB-1]